MLEIIANIEKYCRRDAAGEKVVSVAEVMRMNCLPDDGGLLLALIAEVHDERPDLRILEQMPDTKSGDDASRINVGSTKLL